jgi:hypothetical protein
MQLAKGLQEQPSVHSLVFLDARLLIDLVQHQRFQFEFLRGEACLQLRFWF